VRSEERSSAPRAAAGVTYRAVRAAMARRPGVFEKYRQPDEIAPSRLSAADAPGVDRRRSSLPRHNRRKPTRGSMTAPQRAKNTVVPAPRRTAPPSTGPTTWPMFHWKLSMLSATGTSSGGTRLPIVVHHDGEDVPPAIPMPASPTRSVPGQHLRRRHHDEERHRTDEQDLRHEQHGTPVAGVRRGTGEHDGDDAGERAYCRGEGDQDRRRRQALHDEATDERDHPDTGVGEQARALEPPKCPAAQRGEQFRHRPTQNRRATAEVNSHVGAHSRQGDQGGHRQPQDACSPDLGRCRAHCGSGSSLSERRVGPWDRFPLFRAASPSDGPPG